jgi:hypothetical protein
LDRFHRNLNLTRNDNRLTNTSRKCQHAIFPPESWPTLPADLATRAAMIGWRAVVPLGPCCNRGTLLQRYLFESFKGTGVEP